MTTVISTPVGHIELTIQNDVLVEATFQLLAPAISADVATQPDHSIIQQLQEYFDGKRKDFEFEWSFDHAGTDFQKAVWQTIAEIPYGEVMSYKEIAETIGKPRAYRAVANACGKNFLPVVVPCHRVVGSGPVRGGKPTFTLGGYSSGLDKKRWLMELEGIEL
jgi:methylated-DNA-[protein]-cysteine S-methyltransferase